MRFKGDTALQKVEKNIDFYFFYQYWKSNEHKKIHTYIFSCTKVNGDIKKGGSSLEGVVFLRVRG